MKKLALLSIRRSFGFQSRIRSFSSNSQPDWGDESSEWRDLFSDFTTAGLPEQKCRHTASAFTPTKQQQPLKDVGVGDWLSPSQRNRNEIKPTQISSPKRINTHTMFHSKKKVWVVPPKRMRGLPSRKVFPDIVPLQKRTLPTNPIQKQRQPKLLHSTELIDHIDDPRAAVPLSVFDPLVEPIQKTDLSVYTDLKGKERVLKPARYSAVDGLPVVFEDDLYCFVNKLPGWNCRGDELKRLIKKHSLEKRWPITTTPKSLDNVLAHGASGLFVVPKTDKKRYVFKHRNVRFIGGMGRAFTSQYLCIVQGLPSGETGTVKGFTDFNNDGFFFHESHAKTDKFDQDYAHAKWVVVDTARHSSLGHLSLLSFDVYAGDCDAVRAMCSSVLCTPIVGDTAQGGAGMGWSAKFGQLGGHLGGKFKTSPTFRWTTTLFPEGRTQDIKPGYDDYDEFGDLTKAGLARQGAHPYLLHRNRLYFSPREGVNYDLSCEPPWEYLLHIDAAAVKSAPSTGPASANAPSNSSVLRPSHARKVREAALKTMVKEDLAPLQELVTRALAESVDYSDDESDVTDREY